ncbi:hypothetical protein LWI29_018861 [Acer saccharum]|uniref:DUF4283 domain-containing protein n=1 Tax=Acer saccharum TaxID=4024 RepID=A0AA39S8E8_ACESA|nr:hypothetical protein LWI29_018861 [Acer saccharum]
MDHMCMEAALSLSSTVAVSSTLHSQIGLSTLSGVNSSSRVVPLASGGMYSLVGGPILPQPEGGVSMIVPDSVIVPSVPSKKGGYVSVRVDLIAYQARLELCGNALIGRVVLSNGERPWKLVDLKVWVRLFNLSWEYWHPKIISDLARGIGVPLRLDKATSDGDFGHYARVLVDMDMSSVLPTLVLLERDEFHSSFTGVEYENLPAFCSTCSFIGHLPNSCHWNKSSKVPLTSSAKSTQDIAGDSSVFRVDGFQPVRTRSSKLVYRPVITSQEEVPLSNVFSAIHQNIGGQDSVVAGSNLISGSTSSAGLVHSSDSSSSTVSAISEVV